MSDGLLIDLTDYRILGGTPEVTLLGTGTGQIVMIGTDVLEWDKLAERESRTLHLMETHSDTVIVPVALGDPLPINALPEPSSQIKIVQRAIAIRKHIVGPEDGPYYMIRAGYSSDTRMWFVKGRVESVKDPNAFIYGL